MCEPTAAQLTIQSQPRVSLPALLALRRLVDAVLSSFEAMKEEMTDATATPFQNTRRSNSSTVQYQRQFGRN
jgi:hypothetical protein